MYYSKTNLYFFFAKSLSRVYENIRVNDVTGAVMRYLLVKHKIQYGLEITKFSKKQKS